MTQATMRPADEKRTYDAVGRAISDLERLQRLLPGVFARDDMPAKPDVALAPSPADPVHRSVQGVARAVEAVSRQATNGLNIARHVLAEVPVVGERQLSVVDCLACGQPALPRPRNGYCDACRKAWDRAGRPDRPVFERMRRERLVSGDT